ncbi:DNA polymerase III subunit delta [Mycoplasmopsis bovirhinis]|uniref:DNA polymerase III subunit delta n=1 Tax=Mycoplasmopsis bovirhinis TaxID=29553 RepID=UPI000BB9D8ED|nr:DNA polymerase III subunit delta [Mycoplasmopsis bovirhinis]BBA22421.1 DNA polymerase III subunit delta [Mycoplasmopsis bovirhinis]
MKFIFGDEQFFINKNLNQIKSSFTLDQTTILDDNFEFQDLLDLIAINSLFSDKKLIIVKDFELLTTNKYNKTLQKKSDSLIDVLSNFETQNEVVFILNSAKVYNNAFSNFLIENAKVIECKKIAKKDLISELLILAKERNITFSYSDLTIFLDKMPDNLEIIMNEFNNLTQNYQLINFELIEATVSKYAKNEVFSFLNSIETFNLHKIYEKYLERVSEGEEIISLISQFGNILSDCLNYFYMLQTGLNNIQISEKTKQPLWKIRKIASVLKYLGIKKIKHQIQELGKLDLLSKTTGVNINELFEIFLIKNF